MVFLSLITRSKDLFGFKFITSKYLTSKPQHFSVIVLKEKFSTDARETQSSEWLAQLTTTMKIFPDFITEKEEESLFDEVEPYMKKLRYEFSHWDDVSNYLYL